LLVSPGVTASTAKADSVPNRATNVPNVPSAPISKKRQGAIKEFAAESRHGDFFELEAICLAYGLSYFEPPILPHFRWKSKRSSVSRPVRETLREVRFST
jgi:hypothetical protein